MRPNFKGRGEHLGNALRSAVGRASLPVDHVARSLVIGSIEGLRLCRALGVVLAVAGMASAIATASIIFWRCLDFKCGTTSCTCDGKGPDTDALKLATSASTALLLLVVGYRFSLEFKIMRLRRQLLPQETFWDTHLSQQLLVELVICGMHCPAYVYYSLTFPNLGGTIMYQLDSLLSVVMMLRVYLVFALFADLNGYASAQARVVERFNRITMGPSFTFRSLLADRPLQTVVLLFVVTLLMESYALHVFERPVCSTLTVIVAGWCSPATLGLKDYSSFLISVWNALITSLTIGYGDVYPVTNLGRSVAVLTGITGAINTALLIAAVASSTQLEADERRAFQAIQRHRMKAERKRDALELVRAFLLYAAFMNGHRSQLLSTWSPLALLQQHPTLPPPSKSGAASRAAQNVAVTTNPLGGQPSRRVMTSSHHGLVPQRVRWRLVRATHAWRRHEHKFTEISRVKDDLHLLARDVQDVGDKIAAAATRNSAETHRVARLSVQLSAQVAAVLDVLPAIVSELAELRKATQQARERGLAGELEPNGNPSPDDDGGVGGGAREGEGEAGRKTGLDTALAALRSSRALASASASLADIDEPVDVEAFERLQLAANRDLFLRKQAQRHQAGEDVLAKRRSSVSTLIASVATQASRLGNNP